MKMRLPTKKFMLGMLSILIVFAVLLTVAPSVSAVGFSPEAPIPGLGRLPNETLFHMHMTERGWFTDQDALIKKANQLSAKFQTLIDAQAKAKKNVSELQDALANFDAEVTASTQIHGEAANIIFSLVAWHSTGEVKDRQAAGQSLLDGRSTLTDANFRLTNAMFVLQKSFNLWRAHRIKDQNDPGPTAVPTATCIEGSILPCPVY